MLPLVGERFDRQTFKQFYDDVEHGRYTSEEFKQLVESLSEKSFSTTEFEHAWNSRLLDMSKENMMVVQKLSQKYNLYLLSNTNEIHYRSWWNTIIDDFGPAIFENAFKGFYYSHTLGVMKPDREIYRIVHEGMGWPAKTECLFFDDNIVNVQAAIHFGWRSMVVKNNLSEIVDQIGLL